MAAITPVHGWPYPTSSDQPDGATQMEQLALAIEATVAAITAQYAKGIMAAPVSSSSNGTGTAAENSEE